MVTHDKIEFIASKNGDLIDLQIFEGWYQSSTMTVQTFKLTEYEAEGLIGLLERALVKLRSE